MKKSIDKKKEQTTKKVTLKRISLEDLDKNGVVGAIDCDECHMNN